MFLTKIFFSNFFKSILAINDVPRVFGLLDTVYFLTEINNALINKLYSNIAIGIVRNGINYS